jgi:S1-C subfamily serine protease
LQIRISALFVLRFIGSGVDRPHARRGERHVDLQTDSPPYGTTCKVGCAVRKSISGGLVEHDVSQGVFVVGRNGPGGVTLLGTAFAVARDRLATAYHVAGADDSNLVLVAPKISSLSEYQDTSDTSITLVPLTLAAADPIRDLSIVALPPNSHVGFPFELGNSDEVPPGAPVMTLGFPHANFGRMVLTQQQAHVGARVLIENSGQKSKHIVLNTQAREGQSGGPVFDASGHRVVAVLIGSYAPGGGGGISLGGVDPATLHQTTHAISAEYLGGML